MDNPIHSIIMEQVVTPALNSITREAEGTITAVYYMQQTVDILWRDHQGAQYRSKNVPLPKDGDGIYKQSAKIGDRVKIGFVSGDHKHPFISILYKDNANKNDYRATNGAGIMKGLNFLMGSD